MTAAAQARRAAQIDEAAQRIHRQKAQSAETPVGTPKMRPAMPKWHIDPKIQAKLDAEAAAQAMAQKPDEN